jgi:small-conductance mechanosensitive channel
VPSPAGAERAVVGSEWLLLVVAVAALVANELFFHFLLRVGRRWADRSVPLAIARRCWWPGRVLVPAVAVEIALPGAAIPAAQYAVLQHALVLVIISASGWMIVALSFALEDTTFAYFPIHVSDNLRARRVRTRINVVRRITVGVVSLLTLGATLTTFEGARSLGTTLLASAGIVGILVGLAAQPTISNIIAGLQVFFSEPIRIDDVVVINNEWGRVEEIRLTYIVVRTWDERRLVIPLSHVLNQPFQNWTRYSAHLLGAVYLAVDYTTHVDEVRQELHRVLDSCEKWDRRFWNLQVVDVGKDWVQLRALMTAADASTSWDLQCEVREKLLSFLQLRLPGALPRYRVGVVETGSNGGVTDQLIKTRG